MNAVKIITMSIFMSILPCMAINSNVDGNGQELKTAFDLGFDAGLIPVLGTFFLAEALWTKRPHYDLLVSSAGFALGTVVYIAQYRMTKRHFSFTSSLATSFMLTAFGLYSYRSQVGKLR